MESQFEERIPWLGDLTTSKPFAPTCGQGNQIFQKVSQHSMFRGQSTEVVVERKKENFNNGKVRWERLHDIKLRRELHVGENVQTLNNIGIMVVSKS